MPTSLLLESSTSIRSVLKSRLYARLIADQVAIQDDVIEVRYPENKDTKTAEEKEEKEETEWPPHPLLIIRGRGSLL